MTPQTASKKTLTLTRQLARDKKIRDKESKFILEGEKIIHDSLTKDIRIEYVIISKSFLKSAKKIVAEIESKNISVYEADDKSYESLSTLNTGPGILAVADKLNYNIKDLSDKASYSLVLCDGVQDPSNIGAMIRLAIAFGFDGILLAGDSADIYNPKTVRASSGAVIDLPSYRVKWSEINKLKDQAALFTTVPYGQENAVLLGDIKKTPKKYILAFGSEGSGVSNECKKSTDTFFTIQTNKQIESLNVAQSAAISLHHFNNL